MNAQPTRGQSMVNSLARRVVAPVALVLDIVATFIRIADTSVQLLNPDAYKVWQLHKDAGTAFFWSLALYLVIGAIAIGTTASLFMLYPVIAQQHDRIEAARSIKNKRVKNERIKSLQEKLERYRGLRRLAILTPVLFGVAYFLKSLVGDLSFGATLIQIITAITDIIAPLAILQVLTSVEKEYDRMDAQERTMEASTNMVISQVARVAEQFTGDTLTARQALILKSGMDGDIGGMIDAAVPRDERQRMYTITDLCHKYDCGTDKDDPGRKAIYRKVTAAYAAGMLEIIKDTKKGWMVPGKLLDELFGDWKPPQPALRLVSDYTRTARPVDTAIEAS